MKKIALLIEEFNTSICEIENSSLRKTEKFTNQIKAAQKCLNNLRLELRYKKFDSIDDEIKFFKHQKPMVSGCLKLYAYKLNYLINKPIASKKHQQTFINKMLKNLEQIKKKDKIFFSYFKQGKSCLDKKYFLRGTEQLDLFENTIEFDRDPLFSSSQDYNASEVIFYNFTTKFLKEELEKLSKQKRNASKVAISEEFNDLKWTASKAALIELIKALEIIGALNYGNIDMKKVREFCKYQFGIDIGNYNKAYAQIKERKNDNTKFINQLQLSLQNKINSENRNL